MFCTNCGTKLDDSAQFCHECGAKTGNQAPAAVVTAPVEPKTPQAPKKWPKLLIAIAAVVVVLALVVTAAATIFGGASATLRKAMNKSSQAFLSAAESAGLTDLSALAAMKETSVQFDFRLDSIEGSSELKGLGLRGFLDTGIPSQKIAIGATPYYGSADLITLHVKLDGEKLYIGSPELTKDTYYMVNTKTAGKDLAETFYADDLADLSFNLFDVLQSIEETSVDADVAEAAAKALKAFVKEIEVKKTGTETIEVNDSNLKCTAFHVTITEDALKDLLDELENIYSEVDNTSEYLTILESIGLPDYVISELEYTLEDPASEAAYLFDSMDDLLDELGDVELDMYVNKGYVVAAVYETEIDGTEAEITLNIGGGKNYADNISLRIEADDSVLSFSCSGNHTGKDGKYSSEMVLKLDKETLAKMELSYAPKAKTDNFSVKMTATDFTLKAEGQVDISNNDLSVQLEKVKVNDLITFGFSYQLGKFSDSNIKVHNSKDIAKMSEDDFYELGEELGEGIYEIVEDLAEDIPELEYWLYF